MRLRDYVEYMRAQHDEEPLYIFDPEFIDAAPAMLEAYSVPHLFAQDYFAMLGETFE
jgi:hypothetical protein